MALFFTLLAYVATVVGRIRIAWRRVWCVIFLVFTTLFILIEFLFVWFTGVCILRRIRLFDDESDNDEFGSGYPGTCAFPFCSGNSVGCVSGVGSAIFVPTGIKSVGDVVPLVLFIPRGVESKRGWLIELFWRPKYWFPLLVSKPVLTL